jgi:hypothetical protein
LRENEPGAPQQEYERDGHDDPSGPLPKLGICYLLQHERRRDVPATDTVTIARYAYHGKATLNAAVSEPK